MRFSALLRCKRYKARQCYPLAFSHRGTGPQQNGFSVLNVTRDPSGAPPSQVVPTTASTPFRGGTAQFNIAERNGSDQLTASLLAGAAFIYAKAERAKYLQWNLGTDYALPKRTGIGLVGVWPHATDTDSAGSMAVANIASLSASSTRNQVAIRLNLRHRF